MRDNGYRPLVHRHDLEYADLCAYLAVSTARPLLLSRENVRGHASLFETVKSNERHTLLEERSTARVALRGTASSDQGGAIGGA